METCPNCSKPLKAGMFNVNAILETQKSTLINFFSGATKTYCQSCGNDLYHQAQIKWRNEKQELNTKLEKALPGLMAVSTHTPFQWEYDALGLVTGQAVMGTGVFSEFTSSITDFLGSQSGAFNSKLKQGEQSCLAQLRTQCMAMGGNAIIAIDIDYGEVGSLKGMLMVCMTGTAVLLRNAKVLGEKKGKELDDLTAVFARRQKLFEVDPNN